MQKNWLVLAFILSLFSGCAELDASLDAPESSDGAPELGMVAQEVTRAAPNNLHLADVDGDSVAEFLQVSGNKLFVFTADFVAKGRYHLYTAARIRRVITGNFTGSGRQNVLAVLSDGTTALHDLGSKLPTPPVDEHALAALSSQASFIGDREQAVVGAFDGTGRDNILVYNPRNGGVRLYTHDAATRRFVAHPDFALGNLTGVGTGLQLHAGRFRVDSPRDHLVVLRPGGQLAAYDAVTDGAGKVTFWWAFTTYGGQVASDEDVLVANVTGARASLVLHSRTTGRNRMFERDLISSSTYSLRAVTGVDQGQIDQITPGTQLIFAKLKVSSELGAQRDDVLTFYTSGGYTRVDSRASGSTLTYWWAYTKAIPQLHQAWPASDTAPWIGLKCKFRDSTAEPAVFSQARLEPYLTRSGENTGNLYDYFRDTTYGGVLLTHATMPWSWYTMPISHSEAQAKYKEYAAKVPSESYRGRLIQHCVDAARAQGVYVPAGARAAVFVNVPIDIGSDGSNTLADDALPFSYDHAFMTHEMGHGYGLPHAMGDATSDPYCSGPSGEYCDPWDTMGDGYTYPTYATYGRTAPGFNALALSKLGVLPAHRITSLPSPATSQLTTVTLAALNRPEVNAPLEVRIGIPGLPIASRYLSVELRQKASWDRNIPQNAVLIREVREDGRGYLLTGGAGPQRLAGGGYAGTHGGRWISVVVRSIDEASSTATLEITY